MDYPTFLRGAERGEVAPVVLIHGSDGQLLDDALAAATRGLFPTGVDPTLGREVVDARETGLDVIVRSAMTLPLMTTVRLIAVRRSQALPAKAVAAMREYAADPNPATRLLLLADEPLTASRDRREHWLLGAVPAMAIVELPTRRGRALEEWLRARVAAEGLTLGEEAARMLVQWVGDDSATLLGETRKAALAGDPDGRAIGVREVAAIVGEHRLSGIFDLTRAVERHDLAQSLKILDRLLASEDAPFVLAHLVREVRTAWTVREWRRRGDSIDQIARGLRRPPGVVEAIAREVIRHGDDVWPRRLRRCWEAERRLKSGGAVRTELAALVAELCSGG